MKSSNFNFKIFQLWVLQKMLYLIDMKNISKFYIPLWHIINVRTLQYLIDHNFIHFIYYRSFLKLDWFIHVLQLSNHWWNFHLTNINHPYYKSHTALKSLTPSIKISIFQTSSRKFGFLNLISWCFFLK